MSTITDTAILTKPINVMFMGRFLEVAEYQTHYFTGNAAANLARHGGTFTAFWRRHEHLTPTTTALTELNTTVSFPTRTATTPTITDVTKAVAKYGDHIVLNEEADVVNFNGQTAELMDRLAEQAGRSANMIQRNEMEDNPTLVLAAGAASDGVITSAITAATLNSVINTLDRNVSMTFMPLTTGSTSIGTVPILRSFIGICHPDVAYDIAGLTGFRSVETYAGQVQVLPNEFGFYGRAGLGVRFMSSPDASIDAGSGGNSSGTLRETSSAADLYTTVIYGRAAVGSVGFGTEFPTEIGRANRSMRAIEVINMGFGSAGAADPLRELSTMGWKLWSGPKILNGTWIRGIRSGATAL